MNNSPKSEKRKIKINSFDRVKKFSITVGLCLITYFSTKPQIRDSSLSNDITQKHSVVTDRSREDLEFWNRPKNGEFSPGIAWLMSYPNSGTSFTMTCVQQTSNLSIATNYGDEVTVKGDFSLSIYPRHEEGPFWRGLSKKMGTIRRLPEDFVLVKTHCGSRCVKCGPSEYIETDESFLDACRFTTGRRAPDWEKRGYMYPMERVKKAIHLIRNPYHNFVARFHLERKNAIQKKKDDWLKDHPNDASGFRKWCSDLDNNYKEGEWEMFEKNLIKQLRQTTCHGEVFKYVQWHNLAFQLTKENAIDNMVVFYDDYETKFNATIDTILDFLKLPKAEAPRNFESGHEYSKYYTHSEKEEIHRLIKEIATPTTWKYIERYFNYDDPFFKNDFSQN